MHVGAVVVADGLADLVGAGLRPADRTGVFFADDLLHCPLEVPFHGGGVFVLVGGGGGALLYAEGGGEKEVGSGEEVFGGFYFDWNEVKWISLVFYEIKIREIFDFVGNILES